MLCCFHHYLFHLMPVFIYITVFPLFLLYLTSDHVFIFFIGLFLLESPYTYSWLELFMPSLVVLSCMSITSSLCFGTHSSFGMSLKLLTLTLSPALPLYSLLTFGRTSYVCHRLRLLLHEQCTADD